MNEAQREPEMEGSDPTAGRATGYSYALPGGWAHLDLEPGRRAASVRRAVSGRIRREPRLAPHLAQLDRLLSHECAVAAAGGAERISLLSEVASEGLVTAAVTFAAATLGCEEHAPSAEAILDQLAGEQARARRADPSATTTLASLPGLGPAAAVRREWAAATPVGGRVDGPLSGPVGGPVRTRTWQLVVPWPGRPRVGLLTLSSPAPSLWPGLGPLFDACCQTFHWTFDSAFDGTFQGTLDGTFSAGVPPAATDPDET